MFQRRLRIILFFLLVMTGVLLVRVLQVQVFQRRDWQKDATEMMKHTSFIETTRGNIVDFQGHVLALDEPCVDACVDYRVIADDPDPQFVKTVALARLVATDDYAHLSRARKDQRIADESDQVRRDILSMWSTLAHVSGKAPDEIDDIRRSIVERVERRRRSIWYTYYTAALRQSADAPKPPWYESWLAGSSSNGPNVDDYSITVAEQTEPHLILGAITPDTFNLLDKNIEHFPGLVLRPGEHRVYPFGEAVCHTIGHLAPVDKDDLDSDPFKGDRLREYSANDLIGRGGIEGLCEDALRGIRGQTIKYANNEQGPTNIESVPGRNVKTTLDVELQTDVEMAFEKRRVYDPPGSTAPVIRENQHGAAVVIDVPSGQVRAMVSFPGFDPNTLDNDYPMLVRDDLNTPLLNRATQAQLEPGSTAKTMVGLGAITDGFATPTSTIECTGYLVINGKKYNIGKCWVATQYEKEFGPAGVAHHPFPIPHPTGFLTITDALERSCNVQFETLADKMKLPELRTVFDEFGLGRRTGIGIDESIGHIPPDHLPAAIEKSATWFAGIGQGEVRATPLQMANVAATIARNGIWMRPRLLVDQNDASTQPSGPDTVDLHLAPEALEAVRLGMLRVVNSPAGTGTGLQKRNPPDKLTGILVAGKTGSAQAAQLKIVQRDATGAIIIESGHAKHQPVALGTPGTGTWYIGVGDNNDRYVHAWYIGFAPADKPQVAFCVMVEYGGSGSDAGDIAHDVLLSCIDHGYLSKSTGPEAMRLERLGSVSDQPDLLEPDPDAPQTIASADAAGMGPPVPTPLPTEAFSHELLGPKTSSGAPSAGP